MSDKWDSILSLAKGISGVGGMFGGPFAQMAGQSDDVATAAMVSRELERQKQEQEKQEKASKRGGLGRLVGSTGGAIAGSILLPGIGTAIGAGLGDMAGNAIGTKSAGGDLDMKEMLKGGLESGITSYIAPKVLGSAAQTASAAPGAVASGAEKLSRLPTWMGTHMAQWGGDSPLMHQILGHLGSGIGMGVQNATVRPMVRGAMNAAMPSNAPSQGLWSPYLDERYALANQWGK
jgi:hypothetical protein